MKRDPISQEGRELLAPLRRVSPPDEEMWDEHRRAFLAEVEDFAEKAVTFAPNSRRKGWKGFRLFRLKEAWMFTALKALVVLSLIAGGSAGTVRAAQQSLPGSPLYALKTQIETWQLEAAPNPEAQMEQAMTMAQRRIEEAQKLSERDEPVPPAVAASYERHLGSALQAAEGITEPLKLRAHEHISQTLGTHLQLMEQVRAKQTANGPSEDHDPVQAMIQAMVQTRAQFHNEDAPGHGPVEPGSGAGHQYGHGEAPSNEEENGYGYGEPPVEDEQGHGHGEAPPDEEHGYGHGEGQPNEEHGYEHGGPIDDGDKGNPDAGSGPDQPENGNPNNGNDNDNGNNGEGGDRQKGRQGGHGGSPNGGNGSGNGGGNP